MVMSASSGKPQTGGTNTDNRLNTSQARSLSISPPKGQPQTAVTEENVAALNADGADALPAGKKILPPLSKPAGRLMWSVKDRASQACDQCRKAKVKCSGTLPCVKCKADNRDCRYVETKKDGAMRQQKKMTLTNSTLKNSNKKFNDLLSELLQRSAISPQYVDHVQAVLHAENSHGEFDMVDDGQSTSLGRVLSKRRQSISMDADVADDDDADAGSTRDLDVIAEDPNRNQRARAVGYIGKSSAMSWATRVKNVVAKDASGKTRAPASPDDSILGVTENCYYAEESEYAHIDEEAVNPFDLPEDHIIDQLVASYFSVVHPVYPIVVENEFMQQLEHLRQCDPEDGVSEEDQRSLRLLNLVFAISVRHAQVTSASYEGADNDHLIYAIRARRLGLDNRMLHKDFEVRHIVCIILYGIYQICTDQLNRAWVTIGSAVRHAQALGMHLRMNIPYLCEREQELRVRIWWSIFTLERGIDELLGRPSCIAEHFVAAPMPMNIEQRDFENSEHLSALVPKSQIERDTASATDSRIPASLMGKSGSHMKDFLSSSFAHTFPINILVPTFSTYFILRTQLSMINHEILACIFAPTARHAHWSDIQRAIGTLEERLDAWRWGLPAVFNFTMKEQNDTEYKNRRDGLSMCYYSSRMLLFRPTLCRYSGDDDAVQDDSSEARRWNSRAAGECVAAASILIDRLPEPQHWRRLYDMLPWFDMLHRIVEAASITLLELAYKATHVPAQVNNMVRRVKKTINLLASMSGQSSSARKAWEIFHELLKQVLPGVGANIDDMPTDAPAPSSWATRQAAQERSTATTQESRSKQGSTANWVTHQSSTPRFSALSVPMLDPASHSEDLMDICNSAMQDGDHYGGQQNLENYEESWQAPSYLPYSVPYSQAADMTHATPYFTPNMIPVTNANHSMGSTTSSSNMNNSNASASSHQMAPYTQPDPRSGYHSATTNAYNDAAAGMPNYVSSDAKRQKKTGDKYQYGQSSTSRS